jgi:hypothetical protein
MSRRCSSWHMKASTTITGCQHSLPRPRLPSNCRRFLFRKIAKPRPGPLLNDTGRTKLKPGLLEVGVTNMRPFGNLMSCPGGPSSARCCYGFGVQSGGVQAVLLLCPELWHI